MRDVAEFFKALSDEARVQMIWLLMNRKELCVCDFMEVLGTSQSKASRHLRSLYHAGLVIDRREGTWSYYTLREPEDPLVRSHLAAFKRSLAQRDDANELLETLDRWLEQKTRQQARCAG